MELGALFPLTSTFSPRVTITHIPKRQSRNLPGRDMSGCFGSLKTPLLCRSNSHFGQPRGVDLLVCRLWGPLAPREVGDSANRQVGDLPHISVK